MSDLDSMQLIVLVVTSRYVYQSTFAHDTIFARAMEHHIPVLPILEERGIEQDFNKKCGDIQFLDATARDDTQQPFEAKLKKYLDAVLVGDRLAQQVRDAFDAYIFLSYRKKDRRFAQQLMCLIHENDFCRDIAIWYDEFLVPGENFNAAIRQALEKSKLFALAVTPSLLETPNYVMTEEYPKARTAGKKILPVRLVKTNKKNKKKLRRCYKALPPLLDAGNAPLLTAALRDALAGTADLDKDNEPKHLYFIGLAYLGGIDVEVDYPRAVELITRAAEAGLPEAIEKLVSMYNTGEGVARDYSSAVEWQRRLVAVRQKEYEVKPNADTELAWLNALWKLGDALYDLRWLSEADKAYRAMLDACDSLPADGRVPWRERYIGIGYRRVGDICRDEGDLPAARAWYEKDLAISEPLARKTGTVEARRDLAISYNGLGDICLAESDLSAARVWYEKGLVIRSFLARETGADEARRNLSVNYNKLGDVCRKEGDSNAARAWYEEGLAIVEQLAKETGTAEARRALSVSYERLGDICRAESDLPAARAWYEKDFAIVEQLARETGTVEARRDLAVSYNKLGNLCSDEDDLPAARAWYEKSLAIAELLAWETGTIEARRDLAVCYGRLGNICCAEEDLSTARDWYEKDLAIAEQLARETGTVEARRDLAVSYGRLGNICRAESDLPTARAWYEKCLAIREPLARETGTVEARRDLLFSYENLGKICSDESDLPAARAWYEKCLAIAEPLARKTGTATDRQNLYVCYKNLGAICNNEGNLSAAGAWYEKSLVIAEQLCQQTDQPDIRDIFAAACYNLADCEQTLQEKQNYLKRAEAVWVELSEQCPEILRYENNLILVRRALSEK